MLPGWWTWTWGAAAATAADTSAWQNPAWLAAAPLMAMATDRLLGEPPARWHPVVWMGQGLHHAGQRLAPLANPPGAAGQANAADPADPVNAVDAANAASATHAAAPPHPAPPPRRPWHTFWLAALAWCAMAAAWVAAAALLQAAALQLPPWAAALALGLLLKPLLAWALLRREVLAVEQALAQSLPQGRAQLVRLVSRNVQALDPAQVRESAIESLAENLNDSLIAPLLWFALLGLPGAALYRFANTADAMWGYPGTRGGRQWQWAGKWAARADDALSCLPARLSAALIGLLGKLPPHHWRSLPAQARQTPSPNSGWPMAAMALALHVQLRKPGIYTLHPAGRHPQPADTHRACTIAARSAWLAAATASAALLATLT